MTCLVPISTVSPEIQFSLRDHLTLYQRTGLKGRFKRSVVMYEVDADSVYFIIPIGYKSRLKGYPSTNRPEPITDYIEDPCAAPNEEFAFDKISKEILEGFQLRDNQVPVVTQALDALNRYRTVLLNLECAYGKTLVSLYIAKQLGLKFMFVTPRKNLKQQTFNEAGKVCTGNVQIIDSARPINRNVDGYIISSFILKNYTHEDFDGVGTVILDEMHKVMTPGFIPSLFGFRPKYLIGLTATPSRHDGLKEVFNLFIDPRSRIKADVYKPIRLHTIYSTLQPPTRYNFDGSMNWGAVEKVQAECEWRNRAISALANHYSSSKVFVACKRRTQAKALLALLTLHYPHLKVGRMMENDTSFDRDVDVLVAIDKKTDVGLDGEFNVIILGFSLKETDSVHQLVKRVGRKEGDKPYVIDIVDDHPTLFRHYEARKKWYLKQGVLEERVWLMRDSVVYPK